MSCTLTKEQIQGAISFHGHWCPGLAIGIRAAEWALMEMDKAQDEEIVAVVETDMCGVDAIQYLTGCTFGKGNLIHMDYGKSAFTFYNRRNNKSLRVLTRPDISRDTGADIIKLYKKMTEEGLNEEEEKVWHESRAEVAERIMKSKLTDLFEIKPVVDPAPRKARILTSMVCELCGETVMETRTRHSGGQLLCIPCFELKEKR